MDYKQLADVEFLQGNYSRSAQIYLEGARAGDAICSFNYAYCLWQGIGVEYNPSEAKSFFSFARDLEGGASCYNLAMLYLHGEGVKQNFEKALAYMRASADMGAVEAQLYLGMAYTLGCMFEPDVIGISLIPYHKPIYRDLATPLLSGYVPDYDEEDKRFSVINADAREAFEWFRLSARHDMTYVEELVAKGRYLYAKCFLDGLGTEFDRQRGVRLMLSAGKSGSPEAIAFLKENGVTPEMLQSATRRTNNGNK